MSISYTPENMPYKKLTPFKRYVLQNFPWINEDFDALTNYELMGKIIEYLNNVINNVNNLGEETENLSQAFVELQNYVNNYFENLDIQEEVNTKLDEMAENGELTEIIAQYLQINSILSFNNIADLKNANNLINGSTCYALGKISFRDGFGAYYKIRSIINTDIIDNFNIVALTNYPNLVAERINVTQEKYLLIGDSYLEGAGLSEPSTQNYGFLLKNKLGINNTNFVMLSEGGAGFAQRGNGNHTFLELLQSQIANIDIHNTSTIIIAGGSNDMTHEQTEIETAINNFITYCKTTFDKVDVYIACIGGNSKISEAAGTYRRWLRERSLPAFKNCNKYGGIYINGADKILHNYNFITEGENLIHPNANGHKELASYLYNALKNGGYDYYSTQSITSGNIPSGATGEINFKTGIENDKSFLIMYANIEFTTPINAGYISNLDLGEQNLQFLRFVATSNTNESQTAQINVLYSDNTHDTLPCNIKIDNSNHIIAKLGYTTKAIKKIEMSFTKFYWNYLQV